METFLSLSAFLISLVSGGFALYSFLWTARRDRRQATLEAYNRLQTEVFDALNHYRPSEIEEICGDNRSAEYKKISGYLARIEHFCVGINEDIYDRDTFYALAHGYFDGPQIRRRIGPLIQQKNSGNTGEVFYNDTLEVLEWMEKRAKKE